MKRREFELDHNPLKDIKKRNIELKGGLKNE